MGRRGSSTLYYSDRRQWSFMTPQRHCTNNLRKKYQSSIQCFFIAPLSVVSKNAAQSCLTMPIQQKWNVWNKLSKQLQSNWSHTWETNCSRTFTTLTQKRSFTSIPKSGLPHKWTETEENKQFPSLGTSHTIHMSLGIYFWNLKKWKRLADNTAVLLNTSIHLN
jgi:hypothetical protein